MECLVTPCWRISTRGRTLTHVDFAPPLNLQWQHMHCQPVPLPTEPRPQSLSIAALELNELTIKCVARTTFLRGQYDWASASVVGLRRRDQRSTKKYVEVCVPWK
jgi:hypothetical protein